MSSTILDLIKDRNYVQAYELLKLEKQPAKIYTIWMQIYEGHKYEVIDRKINLTDFQKETIEAVKLYICLSESNWEDTLLSEFRKVSKMMIAETSSGLRDALHSNASQTITPQNFHINSDIRNVIQEFIEHFDKKELYESKADLARVKAQLTLTMNLDKTLVGADMIQYGKFYENVKQFDDSIQIYHSVINDFEEALTANYKTKETQPLELGFLKEAYEGLFRLTKNTEMQQKIKLVNETFLRFQNPSKSNTLSEEKRIEKKSWFKKIFNS